MDVPNKGVYKLLIENQAMQTNANVSQTPPPDLQDLSQICPPPLPVNGMWLFALASDPHECTNLAATEQDVVQTLLDAFDAYQLTARPDLALR